MCIIMVPDDEICQSPAIELKDPEEDGKASILLSSELVSTAEH